VFEDRSHPKRFHLVSTTDDERFAILTVMDPSTVNGDMRSPSATEQRGKGISSCGHRFDDVAWVADDLERNFSCGPTVKRRMEGRCLLIPPGRGLLLGGPPAGTDRAAPDSRNRRGRIFAVYMKDVASRVAVYDTVGKRLDEIALPVPGTVWGIGGENEDTTVFYTFTSFTFRRRSTNTISRRGLPPSSASRR